VTQTDINTACAVFESAVRDFQRLELIKALQESNGTAAQTAIRQAAVALGLINFQAKPRRQRKLTLARLVAKARKLGVDVTIEPNGAATFRTGNSASAPVDKPQTELDEWIAKHAHSVRASIRSGRLADGSFKPIGPGKEAAPARRAGDAGIRPQLQRSHRNEGSDAAG
jgi:hypothetical protein